ncbi:MAG TPA: glycosyltransferase [Candidatus Binatia bacterium]|nr:glycosyltransferase [Candidatus Binatia bacterium]
MSWLLHLPGAGFFWTLLAIALPAFAGGLADDLTRRVGPTPRLLLTMVSAAIAFSWLGAALYRSHMGWLDAALAYWPVSFGATLFAVAGVAHSMNIIDGYNGLSAGVGVLVLLALGVISAAVGDTSLALVSFAGAAAYAGFLIQNYPHGRIFLGDGGAYLLGALIAILAALLVGRHERVSPWFPFVLVVYPVWETLFSVLRRAFYQRTSVGAADARHLHSLIYRRILRRYFPGRDAQSVKLRNAFTTPPLWAAQLLMTGGAVAAFDQTRVLQCQAVAFVLLYCAAYAWIMGLRRPAHSAVLRYLALRAARKT